MRIIAQLVSWLFMPLLMPIYGLLIVMYSPSYGEYSGDIENLYGINSEMKMAILRIFGVLTVLAPAVSFYLLKRAGYIETIEMESKDERQAPIVVMMLYCLLLYFTLMYVAPKDQVSHFIFSLPLSGALVTLAFLFWNKRSKISIHGAGAGILVGFVLAYNLSQTEFNPFWLNISVILSGIVMSMRLYLGKHTLEQVVIGWVLGFVITLATNGLY